MKNYHYYSNLISEMRSQNDQSTIADLQTLKAPILLRHNSCPTNALVVQDYS